MVLVRGSIVIHIQPSNFSTLENGWEDPELPNPPTAYKELLKSAKPKSDLDVFIEGSGRQLVPFHDSIEDQ